MKDFNVAILGCGTVGGGVAQILTELNKELESRASRKINLKKIVELKPSLAAERFNIPLSLFCGGGKDLSPEEASHYTDEIINSEDIDLVVETIGGTSDGVYQIALNTCKAKKHLVTANKALMAEKGKDIFQAARENDVTIGLEAAVCGAIPIIKTIRESFSGDKPVSISGIMNGTSNYILSRMQNEGYSFEEALKLAQENGFAEADPSFDINGKDAGHKLVILVKLAFGIDITMDQLKIIGVEEITKDDIDFANEIDCKIKLICYAKKYDGNIYATVRPMMVRQENFLSEVNGATNAVRVTNKYSGKHILVGAGAGSHETASSIVADIVFAAKYAEQEIHPENSCSCDFMDVLYFHLPYIITFETTDKPGTTGIVTSAIGRQQINIDTVSHNRHKTDRATFSVATMPCTLHQIQEAIQEIKQEKPDLLLSEPKIIPILY